MALQFIYGRAHSGKTGYLLENANKLIQSGNPVVIVVPEQFTHIAEKRFIGKTGAIEQGKAEVLSFDRIAKRINAKFPDSKKQLNSVGRSLIISEIIHNVDFEYYTASSMQPGFAEMCIDEISEMKKYNITPDMLKKACEDIDNKMIQMKFRDLSKIYDAYENAIKSTFSDSDDILRILCDNLNAHRPYEGYTFMFDEFSSFNPSERDVIAALSVQCTDVVFAFCADPEEGEMSVFRPVLGMAAAVKSACENAGCSVKPFVKLSNGDYGNDELYHLEQNLYANSPECYNSPCKNIRIFSSENPYSEVMRLASQIISLVREKNVRYRDIGVVCSDISSYTHIFSTVFKQFGIPFFIDEKTRVLDHAVVNYVVNILDVYINGYRSENVVNFLKSGYVFTDKESIYAADNFITATNATKNTWLSDERWAKALELYSEGDTNICNMLNSVRDDYVLPLSRFHEKIKGRNTVAHITRCLYMYLKESGFRKSIEDYINYFKEEKNTAMAKQYESVWKTLMEAFDMLVYILGEKKVNLKEYRMHLFTAFGQQKIGIIPTSLDEIVIGDVMRSKGEYATYQFVVGVNDGLFPSVKSDCSIVDDTDKVFLVKCGLEYSPVTREKAYFDRFLIYSLLTHPQKSLILSYSLSDSKFSALRPAFVITTLKSIFKNLKENSFLADEIDIFFASDDSAREFLAIAASSLGEGRAVDSRWQDVYSYFKKHSPENIYAVNKMLCKNNTVFKLDKDVTDSLFENEFYSTVSRLQRYNSCRYSYYLEYMLKLREKKTYGLEATDIGTLIHEIIEKVLTEIQQNNMRFEDTDQCYFENKVETLINEYIQQLCEYNGEITERELYSIKRYKTAVVASLMLIRSHFVSSSFELMGNEIVFDDDNEGCIEMTLDNGKKLKITGKIDRADSFTNEDGKFIRVIDYKTGQKKFDYTDVYYGMDIQLLVYLDALVKMNKNAHHAGALYLQIKSPVAEFKNHPDDDKVNENLAKDSVMTGIIADDSHVIEAYDSNTANISNKASLTQFRLLSDYIRRGICTSANSLSDGEIQINPYYKSQPDKTPDSCEYCPYGSICAIGSAENAQIRYLEKISKKTIWSEIKTTGEVNGDEMDK